MCISDTVRKQAHSNRIIPRSSGRKTRCHHCRQTRRQNDVSPVDKPEGKHDDAPVDKPEGKRDDVREDKPEKSDDAHDDEPGEKPIPPLKTTQGKSRRLSRRISR